MNLINKMIYLNKQKAFIAPIIFFLVLCIVFYFIFLPALRKSHALSRQIKDRKIDLTKVQTPTGEYDLLEEKVNKTKEQLEILKKRLFWERDISRFLNELTQLALGLQIEFVSLKPGHVSLTSESEKDKKEFQDYLLAQIPISVTLRCSYDDLVKFLSKVEEADKFTKIDTFNIKSNQRDIYRHDIKMDLSIFSKEEVRKE